MMIICCLDGHNTNHSMLMKSLLSAVPMNQPQQLLQQQEGDTMMIRTLLTLAQDLTCTLHTILASATTNAASIVSSSLAVGRVGRYLQQLLTLYLTLRNNNATSTSESKEIHRLLEQSFLLFYHLLLHVVNKANNSNKRIISEEEYRMCDQLIQTVNTTSVSIFPVQSFLRLLAGHALRDLLSTTATAFQQ